MNRLKTPLASKDLKRDWWIVDAKDKTLGRLASQVARILQGKHKPIYTPFMLCGDYVVVTNAKFITVTGPKLTDKIYDRYTGYPGGRKEISLRDLLQKNPCRVIQMAIRGMLPKNKLAKKMITSLKVYSEDKHPHSCHQPKKLEL